MKRKEARRLRRGQVVVNEHGLIAMVVRGGHDLVLLSEDGAWYAGGIVTKKFAKTIERYSPSEEGEQP